MKQRGWLKAIAIWQITGGVIGGATFLDAVPRLQVSADAKWVVLVPAVILSGLSVLAGWALLEGRPAARGPSLVVHAVQMIGVGAPAFTYRVVLGPYLFVYFAPSGFGVNAGFSPQLLWHTSGSMPFEPHIIVNVLAVTCFTLLLRWTYLTQLVAEQSPSVADSSPRDAREPIGWPPINR
jgi:hypothetical protein